MTIKQWLYACSNDEAAGFFLNVLADFFTATDRDSLSVRDALNFFETFSNILNEDAENVEYGAKERAFRLRKWLDEIRHKQ